MRSILKFWFGASLALLPAGPMLGDEPARPTSDQGKAAGSDAVRRPQAGRQPGGRAITEAGRIERDVIYGKGGDVELKLDLYFPKTASDKPLPTVMYVHGGGWRNGDKAGGAGMMAVQDLLRRGYLFASINYRLAPEHKFPAQIEDVKCAVRFLRAHASEYKLNPNRIGAIGTSAGGHLVALLGVSAGVTDLEGKGGWSDQSSRVQAVADLFGPTDLTMGAGGRAEQLGETVFGAKSVDDPVLKRASPVTYVSKENPPFLMMHGDKDPVVPLRHSEKLLEKLKAAGVASTLVVVTNAGHGFAPAGGEPNPSRAEIGRMIADFFDKSLKP